MDGVKRPPYRIICADAAPCSDITLTDVWLWSETGEAVTDCESAFGTGVGCLRSGSTSSYAAATTSYTKPASYTTLKTMTGDLTAGFTSTASIPAPYASLSGVRDFADRTCFRTIPTTFYPGVAQISPISAVCTAHSTPCRSITTRPFGLTVSRPLRSKRLEASNAAVPLSVALRNAPSSGGGKNEENQFVPLPNRLIC